MKYNKLFLFFKYLLYLYIGLNILIYIYLVIQEKDHRGHKMNTLGERNSYAMGGVDMINFFLPFMIVGSIKSIF